MRTTTRSTSPEIQFALPSRPGPGQQYPSRTASGVRETEYRGDPGQDVFSTTGAAPTSDYPSAYQQTAGPNWQPTPRSAAAAAGDTSTYTGYGASQTLGARAGAVLGGDMARSGADPPYQGYAGESQFNPGYTAGGTRSRPVRQEDIPPPDPGPEVQPRRRRASSGQYDRAMSSGTHSGGFRGDGRSDTFLPAQGGVDPRYQGYSAESQYDTGYDRGGDTASRPVRREDVQPPEPAADNRSGQYPQPRREPFSHHASGSSTETVRERNPDRDRDRNRLRDRDRDGDARGEGATDRREQHGETYQVGQPRRGMQDFDSAYGPTAGTGTSGYYPSDVAIQEEWEGEAEAEAGAGSRRRGGGGHSRDYDREYEVGSGSHGASRRTSQRHKSGGSSRRRRE